MKKSSSILLSLLLAAGLTTTTQAQVRVGIKGGVSFSNFTNQSVIDNGGLDDQYLVNANGGVMLNAPLSSDGFFSVQPELLYSGKGNKLENNPVNFNLRLHYLDLPILAKINANGLILEAGPQASYLAAVRDERNTGNLTTVSTSLDGYNRLTLGYVVGVGYELESGLGIGLRYTGDVSKTLEESATQVRSQKRNSVFQLQIGYLFSLD
ncbi:porin family protein [Hymenobacter chitinivorans]|uniref:Outer membrane protein with beta-barrel domain n=1 Tax=Hymenobacter chitinivorans DSM 11115 TaxID=1121954 RepID=A0A2M9ASY2_9BACT|nr:porin family protein [Hymenobacter chitinivorans]PJJ48804.1 outer membrane protein with beta-barrel domain [Hymenobacter chitinivorans DSM 11115]